MAGTGRGLSRKLSHAGVIAKRPSSISVTALLNNDLRFRGFTVTSAAFTAGAAAHAT